LGEVYDSIEASGWDWSPGLAIEDWSPELAIGGKSEGRDGGNTFEFKFEFMVGET
jgi:hypothetical protein